MQIRVPCKTAIYVLIFRQINPMRNSDCCCIKNKSIFHFFHILANKISMFLFSGLFGMQQCLFCLPGPPSRNAFGY